jgi:hypothetical protein
MGESMDENVREAEEALALAGRMGRPAERAARAALRRYLVATGVATALAVLSSGAIASWVDTRAVGTRAVLTGALWAVLVGAVLWLDTSRPVRALPNRRPVRITAVVSLLVIAATMGVGADAPVAYPIGAAVTLAVWVVGALRVRR